jgi:hypothetical protein
MRKNGRPPVALPLPLGTDLFASPQRSAGVCAMRPCSGKETASSS